MTGNLPTILTGRLRLRPRSLADTDDCLAMDRAPGVTAFVDGPWHDEGLHRRFIEDRTRGPYPPGLGYWTLTRRTEEEFLGWVLLIPCDAIGPEIEIGWRLVPAAWGFGLASEAGARLLQYAFEVLRLEAVIADIDVRNARSRRVAERIGMIAGAESVEGGRTCVRYRAMRGAIVAGARPAPSSSWFRGG